MKVIQGTVIKVALGLSKQSQAGKAYDAYQLVYTDEAGEVKDWTKPMQGLKFKPKVAEILNELKAGDPFTLAMEKNAGGFFDIVTLEKGHKDVVDAGTTKVADKPAAPTTRVTGSTYETAAERAVRQKLIVRQSSLGHALTYFELNKAKASVDDVLTLAGQFESFVFADPAPKE